MISRKDKAMTAYLLIRIHSGKAALAGLTSFRGDLLDLFLRTVGEVAGVGVVSHDDDEGWKGESCEYICSE